MNTSGIFGIVKETDSSYSLMTSFYIVLSLTEKLQLGLALVKLKDAVAMGIIRKSKENGKFCIYINMIVRVLNL